MDLTTAIALYRDQLLPLRTIAKMLSVDKGALIREFRRAGVPRRSKAEAAKLAADSGRKIYPRGSDHGQWTGGRARHSEGYITTSMPTHPRANPFTGHVYEHIVVMERKLGRALNLDETVHHIDHNRANNDPKNLAVMTRSDHGRMHALEYHRSKNRVESKVEQLKLL